MNSIYQRKVSEAKGQKNLLEAQSTKLKGELNQLKEDQMALEEAQTLLQMIAKETQEQFKIHIEDIVQLALDACFPEIYRFSIVFEIKRGKTEATLLFWKGDHTIDPIEESGGGVVDLAAFALRIACWSLGNTDNVVVLDEPFRFLSKDLQPQAAEIMKRISHKLNLQFIMVTHNKELIECSDKVFEVIINENGISTAKETTR